MSKCDRAKRRTSAQSPLFRVRAEQRGVALILVILIITLASIIVLNLASSTSLGSEMNMMISRSFRAEYLLKSAINFARVLLREDTSPEDAPQDTWAQFFMQGRSISNIPGVPNILGLDEPGLDVELEIRAEEAKLSVRNLRPTSVSSAGASLDEKWRQVFIRLFRELGFDQDDEKDHTGFFPDRPFLAEEMVANMIDYIDADDLDYTDPGGTALGIESKLPKGYFKNEQIQRIGELGLIPGFSPARMRKLSPFITSFGSGRININLAPAIVLRSLHEDMTDSMVQSIMEIAASKEPFAQDGWVPKFQEIVGLEIFNDISVMIDIRSNWFQAISKVTLGNSWYFMRAYLQEDGEGVLPNIRSVELY